MMVALLACDDGNTDSLSTLHAQKAKRGIELMKTLEGALKLACRNPNQDVAGIRQAWNAICPIKEYDNSLRDLYCEGKENLADLTRRYCPDCAVEAQCSQPRR